MISLIDPTLGYYTVCMDWGIAKDVDLSLAILFTLSIMKLTCNWGILNCKLKAPHVSPPKLTTVS